VLKGVNDSFWVRLLDVSGNNYDAKITATSGLNIWYDGDSLAAQIETKLNISSVGTAAPPTGRNTTWNVDYSNGGILIYTDGNNANKDFFLYPINPANIGTQSLQQNSLLNVMGFDPLGNWQYLTTYVDNGLGAGQILYRTSSFAPLTYTSYIDFVSNNLTKYQEVNDSSSKTNSTGGIILRLFLNDETSTVPVNVYDASGVVITTNFGNAGSFPFVINRQFVCPKVFKWNPGAAIDSIDLQLFDDTGAPLQVPEEGLPNFQITFLATEE
jgi:hypothetical protein